MNLLSAPVSPLLTSGYLCLYLRLWVLGPLWKVLSLWCLVQCCALTWRFILPLWGCSKSNSLKESLGWGNLSDAFVWGHTRGIDGIWAFCWWRHQLSWRNRKTIVGLDLPAFLWCQCCTKQVFVPLMLFILAKDTAWDQSEIIIKEFSASAPQIKVVCSYFSYWSHPPVFVKGLMFS